MPNHCENDLYITAPYNGFGDAEKAERERLVQECLDYLGAVGDKPKFDFNQFIPYPEKWRQMDDEHSKIGGTYGSDEWMDNLATYREKWGTDKDGYNSGGYEWCADNWGTKWNAYAVARRDFDGDVIVSFETAWAPPLPVIEVLADKFPHLQFRLEYFEQGVGFYGGVYYECVDTVAKYDEERKQEWKGEYHGWRGG